MGTILKSLDLNNKYYFYLTLPEKQKRSPSRKPVGYKHSKGNEVEDMFNKMWGFFDGGDIYKVPRNSKGVKK